MSLSLRRRGASLRSSLLACLLGCGAGRAADLPGAANPPPPPPPPAVPAYPLLLGLQETYIVQRQSPLHSPYAGPLSLRPNGDTQPSNTLGIYTGWAPARGMQLYLDAEKFDGAGDSGATGLAGLTNGDVVRGGAAGLKKEFYIARLFGRFIVPLGGSTGAVERDRDQLPGVQPERRLELKIGRLAATDDFDQNRYAGDTRTQFLNWSLWANTAWDYAANTRGYTNGAVFGFLSPGWSLQYGLYQMPLGANEQTLDYSWTRAHSQNLQLTLSPWPSGAVVRLLAYLNTARMGLYSEALALASARGAQPDIVADDRVGRSKYGLGINAEQPLADDGETGLFMRAGWNDGRTESFAFTEVDRQISLGGQISGARWGRPGDRWGVAAVSEWLSGWHRAYLAAGGCGFVLCDGRLTYGPEQILETYYRMERVWPEDPGPVRWQLSPDVQFLRNPGYNRDRGPVTFWTLRLHVEY